ncbi:MAG: hypothetical protein ACP5O7_09715, partial [Phycisphaerae bacterium]
SKAGSQRIVPSKSARDAAKIGMIQGRQKILPHPLIEDLSKIAMRWAGFFIYFYACFGQRVPDVAHLVSEKF